MKLYRLLIVLALSVVPTAYVFAWPDQPPDSAFISGPGLNGDVPITDVNMLKSLCLGCFEDFNAVVAEPESQERYTIHRTFYDNTFDFGVLTYVPADGGYVRFDDGPDLVGTPTEYNGKWFRVKPEAQTQMTQLLGTLTPTTSLTSSNSTPASLNAVWLWVVILVGVLAGAGWVASRKLVPSPN